MPINSGQFNTEHHDEQGLEKPQPHAAPKLDAEHPGYEVEDVNTKGVLVFMGGMFAFLVVFFVFCYAAGMAINYGLLRQDSDEESRNPNTASLGISHAHLERGTSMTNNPEMEQKESAIVAQSFPTPRLDADDSNQETANLHAREDLLLNYYTAAGPAPGAADGTAGTVRIPIDVAMQLLVKRGLPSSNGNSPAGTQATASANSPATPMVGDAVYQVHEPLTDGFARTSYEQDQIEKRGQAMELQKAQNNQHASLAK